ncbi:MAG TPA: hypothetical protein VGJ70_16860 [Solirubrobacteraceae bacterium]
MHQAASQRPEQDRLTRAVEILCVVVVVAAAVGLLLWMLFHTGGGVLYHG